MISKILVGVDGSPHSADVVSAAYEIADALDARVYLFRAIQVPPDFPPAAHVSARDTLQEVMERQAQAALATLAAKSLRASFLPVSSSIGSPWRAICTAADEIDADLIVIGSHGYSGWDRFLGTTAARVADRATRNVLIVHRRGVEQAKTKAGTSNDT